MNEGIPTALRLSQPESSQKILVADGMTAPFTLQASRTCPALNNQVLFSLVLEDGIFRAFWQKVIKSRGHSK